MTPIPPFGSSTCLLAPPRMPSAEELYDAIMGSIEPELTIAGAKTLARKYAGETAQAKAARAERYRVALERYTEQATRYLRLLETQLANYTRSAFARLEGRSEGSEQDALDQLSANFSQVA